MKVTKTVSDIKLLWGETTPTGPVTGRLPINIRRAEMPGLTGCWSLASIFVKIQYWLGSFIRINKGGFMTTYPALNVSKRKTLILWVERVCVSWKQAGGWPTGEVSASHSTLKCPVLARMVTRSFTLTTKQKLIQFSFPHFRCCCFDWFPLFPCPSVPVNYNVFLLSTL